MTESFNTDQEAFWAGDFGNSYIERNNSEELLAANLHYFSRILEKRSEIGTTFEVGCNIGMNTKALSLLLPKAQHHAVEINTTAADQCRQNNPKASVTTGSILNYEIDTKFDLVFSKGVLIHLNPDSLVDVYKKMASMSQKYVLIGEYFNPSPVSIPYRGNDDKLFKRDFAGEFLQTNPEFSLLEYNFHYKGSNHFSQDDITWFLMEK